MLRRPAVGPHCGGGRDSNNRPGVCLQGVCLAACADPERAQECAHWSVPTGDGHSVGAGPGPGTCHGLARGPVRVRVRRAVTPAGPMASVTRLRCPTPTQVPAFKLPPGPRGPSPDPTRTSEWAGFDPGRADPDRTPARFCCRRPCPAVGPWLRRELGRAGTVSDSRRPRPSRGSVPTPTEAQDAGDRSRVGAPAGP